MFQTLFWDRILMYLQQQVEFFEILSEVLYRDIFDHVQRTHRDSRKLEICVFLPRRKALIH